MMKPGFVYMMTNKPGGVLYLGVTDDLAQRVEQHRSGKGSVFTRKYHCHQLVWFERFENIHDARQVEFRMKKWKREWKVRRIEEVNPKWDDLAKLGPFL
jgi:putative endonuclease